MSWIFRILTPTTAAGGVAVIRISGDADHVFSALHMQPIEVGTSRVRMLAGIDRGLVCRWKHDLLDLMPHGGTEVVRTVAAWLTESGGTLAELSRSARWPEASSDLEARMLDALGASPSPAAVPLLLAQPERWAASNQSDPFRDRILNRLLEPPLVVAIGPPNVGKSSLLNALAGRTVSITADEPGTTRDHVGVMLDLGGLAVRYADTPGIRPNGSSEEQEAIHHSLQLLRTADLILSYGDTTAAAFDLPTITHLANGTPPAQMLHIGTRADLGPAQSPVDCSVSTKRPESVATLAALIRETLVPLRLEIDPKPWRFWAD